MESNPPVILSKGTTGCKRKLTNMEENSPQKKKLKKCDSAPPGMGDNNNNKDMIDDDAALLELHPNSSFTDDDDDDDDDCMDASKQMIAACVGTTQSASPLVKLAHNNHHLSNGISNMIMSPTVTVLSTYKIDDSSSAPPNKRYNKNSNISIGIVCNKENNNNNVIKEEEENNLTIHNNLNHNISEQNIDLNIANNETNIENENNENANRIIKNEKNGANTTDFAKQDSQDEEDTEMVKDANKKPPKDNPFIDEIEEGEVQTDDDDGGVKGSNDRKNIRKNKDNDDDNDAHMNRIDNKNAMKSEALNHGFPMRLLLDAKKVGGLIGKGGCSISSIRAKSNAKILIAKPCPHAIYRVCSVEGQLNEMIVAINMVIDKMAEEAIKTPPFSVTLLVEEKNIGCLIGKQGKAITEIRNKTNANIYISSNTLRNSSEKTVDISGERDAVHDAIDMIVHKMLNNPSLLSTRRLYDPQNEFIPNHRTVAINDMQQPFGFYNVAAATAHVTHGNGVNVVSPPRTIAEHRNAINYAAFKFGAIPSNVSAVHHPQLLHSTSPNRVLSPLSSPGRMHLNGNPNHLLATLHHNAHLARPVQAPTATLYNPTAVATAPPSNSLSSIPHTHNVNIHLPDTSKPPNIQNAPQIAQNHKNRNKQSNYANNNNHHNLQANNHNNHHSHGRAHNHYRAIHNNNRNILNNNNEMDHAHRSTHSPQRPHAYPHLTHVIDSNPAYFNRVMPTIQTAQFSEPQQMPSVVVLPVPSHLIGGVIGRGGRNIQDIRRQTHAEIKIDNERQNQSHERYVTISGSPQQIAHAYSMIQQSVSTHS